MINSLYPLLDFFDGMMALVLGPLARIVLWGGLGGALSMGLYRVCSPQAKLASIVERSSIVRKQLLRYDGDLRGMWRLTGRSMGLSLRHLWMTLGPALLASVPLVVLLLWMSIGYGHAFPAPGAEILLAVDPPAADVAWPEGSQPGDAPGSRRIEWPEPGVDIPILSAHSQVLAQIPLPAPIPVIAKRCWWNVLVGSPAGYLPAEGEVERMNLELPRVQYIAVGPGWMRSWEAVFFFSCMVVSLILKFVFRIR